MPGIFGESIDVGQSSPEVDAIFGNVNDDDDVASINGQGDPTGAVQQSPSDDNDGQLSEPTYNKNNDNSGLILGKFKTAEDLETAYINLMENKLGKSVDGIMFDSVEQLAEAYKEAEKELGKKANKQKTVDNSSQSQQVENDEVIRLRQTVQQQQAQLQQIAQLFQQLQFQAQQQQQLAANLNQNDVQTQQQQPELQFDSAQILDELYTNPISAIQKVVNPLLEQKARELQQLYQQQYQQLVNQQLAPVISYVAQEQLLKTWQKQVDDLQKALPDFEDYKQDVWQEIQKDQSMLAIVAQNPLAMGTVIRTAYDRAKANKLAQQLLESQQQQQKNQLISQKKASRIQTGGVKRVLRQPTAAEREVADIFGLAEKPRGIFG